MKWELEIIWENKETQKDPSITKKLKVEKLVFHVENMKLMKEAKIHFAILASEHNVISAYKSKIL